MIAVDNRWGDDQLRHQTSVAVGGARRNAARTACSARKRSRDGLSPDDSGPPPPLTPPNWRPSTAETGYALSSALPPRAQHAAVPPFLPRSTFRARHHWRWWCISSSSSSSTTMAFFPPSGRPRYFARKRDASCSPTLWTGRRETHRE